MARSVVKLKGVELEEVEASQNRGARGVRGAELL